MTTNEIRTKLKQFEQKLPEYTEGTKAAVKGWEKELTDIEMIEGVANHPVIKKMVADYEGRIDDINTRLLEEDCGGDIERRGLFGDRKAYQIFVDAFDIKGRKESLYKIINSELKE
jgi:hypothetical protein